MKNKQEQRIDQNKYSPSNIETWRQQKFYYKLEWDWALDLFIEIFKKNGNDWEMNKEVFEKAIDKRGIDREGLLWYTYVYNDALEVIDDKIRIREYIVEELIKYSYQFSSKNVVKQAKKGLVNILWNTNKKQEKNR